MAGPAGAGAAIDPPAQALQACGEAASRYSTVIVPLMPKAVCSEWVQRSR